MERWLIEVETMYVCFQYVLRYLCAGCSHCIISQDEEEFSVRNRLRNERFLAIRSHRLV